MTACNPFDRPPISCSDSSLVINPEATCMRNLDASDSTSPSTDEVPGWLAETMLGSTASTEGDAGELQGTDGDDSPAHASGGHASEGGKSCGLVTSINGECAGEDNMPGPGGRPLDEDQDDVPLPPPGLDAMPSASRYSYGDFSSASSTTSSSASTSGFSSHSTSSATTVSSTTTFFAAGWNGQVCSPHPAMRSFTAFANDCLAEVDTPVADSGETVLPAPTSPLSAAADETVTLSSLCTSEAAHFDRPASPSTASTSSVLPSESSLVEDDAVPTPPDNFAMVNPGLYRSSYPRRANFSFLKSLGLKSVMTLVEDSYAEENIGFYKSEGIQFFQFSIPANKEPAVSVPEEKLVAALAVALDKRNYPMLIHCNKGKHRTGCLIGCLRRLQSWSLPDTFEEYRCFSHPKSRAMDLQCIEEFGGVAQVREVADPNFLPIWAEPDPPPPPS
ncbi:hypothetical protein JCM11641_006659 [Rhodosporidiobolus odoratus]